MRLISEEAFEKVISDRMIAAVEWWKKTPTPEIEIRAEQAVATFCEALLTAKTLPTVDAVEVVRCIELEPEDYCSRGERIEDGKRD